MKTEDAVLPPWETSNPALELLKACPSGAHPGCTFGSGIVIAVCPAIICRFPRRRRPSSRRHCCHISRGSARGRHAPRIDEIRIHVQRRHSAIRNQIGLRVRRISRSTGVSLQRLRYLDAGSRAQACSRHNTSLCRPIRYRSSGIPSFRERPDFGAFGPHESEWRALRPRICRSATSLLTLRDPNSHLRTLSYETRLHQNANLQLHFGPRKMRVWPEGGIQRSSHRGEEMKALIEQDFQESRNGYSHISGVQK